MKEKLRAIWMILFAQKIAVFTWKEGTPDELNTQQLSLMYYHITGSSLVCTISNRQLKRY